MLTAHFTTDPIPVIHIHTFFFEFLNGLGAPNFITVKTSIKPVTKHVSRNFQDRFNSEIQLYHRVAEDLDLDLDQ